MRSVGRHTKKHSGADDGGDVAQGGGLGRRGFLRTSAGAATAALASGAAATPVAAQSGPDYGGWFDGVGNYDGTTVDKTGQDQVTVTVGAQGNGGTFAFAPPAVRVSPGTTVEFVWESDTHNVVVESQPSGASWSGHETIEDSGFSFTHTFETEGIYKYFCQPHKTMGMKGAIVVGGGGGGAVGEPDYGGWFDGVGNYDSTVDKRGQDEVTVTVGAQGNGGTFAFAPAAVRVSPGTTVEFVWESDTHNVVVESQPSGASWSGHETIEDSGFSFTHTFETKGIYKYFCQPHKTMGMKGAIVVGNVGGGGGGETGGSLTLTPGLSALLGAAGMALLSPLVFGAYLSFRNRRGAGAGAATGETGPGGVREAGRRLVRATGPPETEEAAVEAPENEIGHDEYDPIGTVVLVGIYFLIVVLMWLFMYFVEFLGNGPTVVG